MPKLTPIEWRGGLKFVWECCDCGATYQEEQVSGEECPNCVAKGKAHETEQR